MFESDNEQEAGSNAEELGNALTGETSEGEQESQGTPVVDTIPKVDEDPLYEVTVNGKKMKLPLSEIRNGYQRNKDYTQKTMELSEMRKNWERERADVMTKVAELRKWISDPNNLKSYYQQLTQGVIDSNEDQPLTAAQVQQMVAAQMRQQQELMNQAIQKNSQEFELKQSATQISNDINVTIKGLLTSHPELASVDGIEALLYRDVAAQEPESVEEAKRFFAEAAQKRADRIRSLFTEQKKLDVVQKEKLTKNGIQPPGGSPVLKQNEKKFKLGDVGLLNSVVADLMAGNNEEN